MQLYVNELFDFIIYATILVTKLIDHKNRIYSVGLNFIKNIFYFIMVNSE